MNRAELQQQAMQLFLNNKNILLQWGTSVGKGYFGVKALSALKPNKTLLLVAETAHKQNWKGEFINQKQQNLLSNCTIACYASLKKFQNTEWDCIIMDECHHACSELRLNYLSTIKSKKVLALSATMKQEHIAALESIFGDFKINKVNLQNAIDDDILPEPIIYLIPLELNKTINTEIIEESWGNKNKRVTVYCSFKEAWTYRKNKKKFPNMNLVIACTQYQKYSYICEQFTYWQNYYMRNRNDRVKNMWLQWGSKRKVFLGSLKTAKVQSLVAKLEAKNKRFICFCTNIQQASLLGGENAVHSKVSDVEAKIEAFNNKKIDSLFCCQMLTEGQNLKDIEAGIIAQLDGNERSFVQKFGRVMRAKNPELYIFYYKGTRDEEFLNNAIQGIDSKFIVNYENHT